MRLLYTIFREERGATSIEYGLICALIAIAIVTSVGLLGGSVQNKFTNIGNRYPTVS